MLTRLQWSRNIFSVAVFEIAAKGLRASFSNSLNCSSNFSILNDRYPAQQSTGIVWSANVINCIASRYNYCKKAWRIRMANQRLSNANNIPFISVDELANYDGLTDITCNLKDMQNRVRVTAFCQWHRINLMTLDGSRDTQSKARILKVVTAILQYICTSGLPSTKKTGKGCCSYT